MYGVPHSAIHPIGGGSSLFYCLDSLRVQSIRPFCGCRVRAATVFPGARHAAFHTGNIILGPSPPGGVQLLDGNLKPAGVTVNVPTEPIVVGFYEATCTGTTVVLGYIVSAYVGLPVIAKVMGDFGYVSRPWYLKRTLTLTKSE